MSIKYYQSDRIKKENATINLIIGERSNGKSYRIKHDEAIDPFMESYNKLTKIKDGLSDEEKKDLLIDSYSNLHRFFLIRRLETEIKNSYVERYFADVDIYKITNKEYDSVDVYRGEIFFAKYDMKARKKKRGVKIGYVGALSTEQNYAMQSFLDVYTIIFEEFMSRSAIRPYLPNEPDKLMNFYSTIDRKRHIVKLWLIGNTISKVCPYYSDWGLMPIMRKLKQGDIATTMVSTGYIDPKTKEEEFVKIAIEFCESSGKSSGVIGKHSRMLNEGGWQNDPQPLLPDSIKNYNIIYRIGFEFKEFRFIGEYLKSKITKDYCWFVYPYNKEFKEKDLIIISDKIVPSIYYQRNIYDITINNPNIQNVLNTFRETNIFYASYEAGTDFKQAIDFSIRK